MTRLKLGISALVLLVISACVPPPGAQSPIAGGGTVRITVNGTQYTSVGSALQAVRTNSENYIQAIPREETPLARKGRIVIPDYNRLRPVVLSALAVRLKRAPTAAESDFYVGEDQIFLCAVADAMIKAGLFETASLVEQNDVRNPEIGDADYLVWYQVRNTMPDNSGAWSAHWLVRRAGSNAAGPAAMDPGVESGTARYVSFIKSVREASQRLAVASGNATPQRSADGSNGQMTFGTGITISTQGDILTNEHVARACTDIRVVDQNRDSVQGTVIARDVANDLAVIRTSRKTTAAATFREGRDLRAGENVVVAGFPLATLVASEMAVTTGSLTVLSGIGDDSRFMQFSAPIQPGNSGGPLLDASGNVIGVVSLTLGSVRFANATGAVPQNLNFAIKTPVIRNFLETNRMNYLPSGARHDVSNAEVGDIARKFTVRVECRK